MSVTSDREQALLVKVRDLSDESLAQVETFVDFLRARDEQRDLVPSATAQSEPSLAAVWDNPEDDAYNTEPANTAASSVDGKASERCSSRDHIPQIRRFIDDAEKSLKNLVGVARMNLVYEQYVKPIEQNHLNEYVLVRPDGEMFFAPTMLDAVKKAHELGHPDNCLFKVGEGAATKIL
jgi:hypothetical protein